jgi:hypothetical protein
MDHWVPSFLFGDPSYVLIFLFTSSFANMHQVLNLLFNRQASPPNLVDSLPPRSKTWSVLFCP